ncbi:MAG: invasion associated locus B family protein [Bdellovibrionales bacterium]
MRKSAFFPFLFVFSFLAAVPVQAAVPKSLGKYGYWSTYKMIEGKNPVCYMSLTAKAPTPKAKSKKKTRKRGDVVLMITHRPAEGATDVISYTAGAKFRPASDVTFKMGKKEFNLFTQGDTAWARDQATDHAVAMALRENTSVSVFGVASNGVTIADTVKLNGFADAYYRIGKACDLPVEPPPKPEKKKVKTTSPKKTETKSKAR